MGSDALTVVSGRHLVVHLFSAILPNRQLCVSVCVCVYGNERDHKSREFVCVSVSA